jgi:hypothetical protein
MLTAGNYRCGARVSRRVLHTTTLCGYIDLPVSRPTRFEHQKYLGDKRNQQVFDLDLLADDPQTEALVEQLIEAEAFITFGPDTLAEARNRGYRPHASIRRRLEAEAEED